MIKLQIMYLWAVVILVTQYLNCILRYGFNDELRVPEQLNKAMQVKTTIKLLFNEFLV